MLLGPPDGPVGDWDPVMAAFEQAHETAIGQFRGYLAEKLREIMVVEYVFANDPGSYDGEGPHNYMEVAQRLSDIQEWEHGQATFVQCPLGPADLETLDTLIMAGTAGTRPEAIRWAMNRIRERSAYRRLRELRKEADMLRNEF